MAEYDLPGADYIPGLTQQDYSLGQGIVGEEAGLLDWTPPNVQWQAPLAQMGENIYANYVKTSPGLLAYYNERLARPSTAAGALPMEGGRPQSMASWGRGHWLGHPEAQGVTRFLPGDEGYTPGALWSDPGRSPYIGYGGGVAEGIGTGGLGSGISGLPQPDVEGHQYAYPIYSRYSHPSGHYGGEERYQPGTADDPFGQFYTTDIERFPYFPYLPANLATGTEYNNQPYILVGQSLLPTTDQPSQTSIGSDIYYYR
jgi:hypothetical protein